MSLTHQDSTAREAEIQPQEAPQKSWLETVSNSRFLQVFLAAFSHNIFVALYTNYRRAPACVVAKRRLDPAVESGLAYFVFMCIGYIVWNYVKKLVEEKKDLGPIIGERRKG